MIVSVADDRDLGEVAAALVRAGLAVTEVLAGAGVVTGTVDGAAVAALSTVPGVVDVEVEREVRLPPPDSPLQ
ncbi:hypothetical protein [Actinophytocola gossypii]|uniref:hypothetical protein n=1 Tax=Actinophytocola gossypii TaxID=2812003 RepID=UPI0021A2DF0A|nr:hypothetical protein [Actinophytocola gossypii]